MWRIHKLLWSISGGRLGSNVGGFEILELITTGHKSGQRRSVLLYCLSKDGGPLVAGSNLGAHSDPAWVKNLRANPTARIVFAGRTSDITAWFLEGDERSAAFLEFKDRNDDYSTYEQMTDRRIPIIKLETSN